MTTINEHLDQLLDQAAVTDDAARSYAFNFQYEAVERIFEYDSIETERCDLGDRVHRELIEEAVTFLFGEDGKVYVELRTHKIHPDKAGQAFTDLRMGGEAFMVSEEVTSDAKSYGDVGVY